MFKEEQEDQENKSELHVLCAIVSQAVISNIYPRYFKLRDFMRLKCFENGKIDSIKLAV